MDIDDLMPSVAHQCEPYLQLALNDVPALTWYSTPDGRLEYHSRRWTEYTGLELKDSLGDGWMQTIHPDDLKLVRAGRMSVPPDEDYQIEMRMRRHDGVFRWFLLRVGIMRDEAGNVVRRFGINVDIEDRKQADAERSRTERYLKDAQRLSKTGSFYANLETGVHSWSDETYQIFQYDQSIKPSDQMMLDRVYPEDRYILERSFVERRAGRPLNFKYRLLFSDGSIKFLHVIAVPDRFAALEATYIGAIMDVTEVSEAQDGLNRAHAALAHATRATTLGELAASIAHEVNQPLAGIVSNAQACQRWLDQPTPDIGEILDGLGQIVADGQRAAEVIRRLRALARKSDPEFIPLNVNDVVSDTLPLVQRELLRNGVALELSLGSDLPSILGDKIQLQQVVINLISNALQAMARGHAAGKTLSILTQCEEDGRVNFSISDSGPGFEKSVIDLIFHPFFTTKENGMGMGLSISRTIIEAHGGEISAENNEHAGAKMKIALPVYMEPACERS